MQTKIFIATLAKVSLMQMGGGGGGGRGGGALCDAMAFDGVQRPLKCDFFYRIRKFIIEIRINYDMVRFPEISLLNYILESKTVTFLNN